MLWNVTECFNQSIKGKTHQLFTILFVDPRKENVLLRSDSLIASRRNFQVRFWLALSKK